MPCIRRVTAIVWSKNTLRALRAIGLWNFTLNYGVTVWPGRILLEYSMMSGLYLQYANAAS